MIQRYDLINHFTSKFDECKYLEIGSAKRECFDLVKAHTKHDIEPDLNCYPTFQMTSDAYFKLCDIEYDVIFIDGLHHYEQVLRDIDNSSKYLSKNGYIIIHDCLPRLEIEQLREQVSLEWTGDVWKAQAWLIEKFKNVFTISDSDCGCGIIEGRINFGIPEKLEYEWEYFANNTEKIMNSMRWQEYLNRKKITFNGKEIIIYEF